MAALRRSGAVEMRGYRRVNEPETAPEQAAPETKDPSGGTTGRVKPYGRLGWMGARAEYSLDGEG